MNTMEWGGPNVGGGGWVGQGRVMGENEEDCNWTIKNVNTKLFLHSHTNFCKE